MPSRGPGRSRRPGGGVTSRCRAARSARERRRQRGDRDTGNAGNAGDAESSGQMQTRPRHEDHGPSQADAMVKRQSHPDGHLQERDPPFFCSAAVLPTLGARPHRLSDRRGPLCRCCVQCMQPPCGYGLSSLLRAGPRDPTCRGCPARNSWHVEIGSLLLSRLIKEPTPTAERVG